MADFKRIIQRTTNSERVETGVADLQPNEICIVEDGEELIYKDRNGKFISVSKDKYKVGIIEELKNSKKYKVGDVVDVLGYYTKGDGAGHTRQKKPAGYNGADAVIGADGSIWGIVHSGKVNVSWLGAKGDGITDDTLAFQNSIDTCNIVNIQKGIYALNKINLKPDTTLVGEGKYNTILSFDILENIFDVKLRNVITDFSIELNNPDFTNAIFHLNSTDLRDVEKGDLREVKIKRINIRANKFPVGYSSILGSVFKLYAHDVEGIYKLDIEEVNATRAGRFLDAEAISGGWINSNKIRNCYSWAGYGLVRLNTIGASEIRDNIIDVNLQNDSNYQNTTVYDIPNTFQIKDNKISGYIWDLQHESTGAKGCLLGSCGCNYYYPNELQTQKYFNGDFIFIGTLGSSSGNNFVDFQISRYAYEVDRIKIAIVNGIPDMRFYKTSQELGLEFYYKLIDNIYYLYAKSPSAYLDFSISNSQGFTNAVYMSAIKTLTGYTKMHQVQKKSEVLSVDGEITNLDFRTSVSSKITSSSLQNLDELLDGSDKRGVSFLTATGTNLGLDSTQNYNVVYFDKGSMTALNNYGSNVLAIGQHGEIHIKTYRNGWGAWGKVQIVTSQLTQLNTPYYTMKMEEQGILQEYYTYLDELHAYEKQQKELEAQLQLAFEQRDNQEQTYEEWLSQQPMMLPVDNKPEPSENILKFAKEYNLT